MHPRLQNEAFNNSSPFDRLRKVITNVKLLLTLAMPLIFVPRLQWTKARMATKQAMPYVAIYDTKNNHPFHRHLLEITHN